MNLSSIRATVGVSRFVSWTPRADQWLQLHTVTLR